MRFTHDFREIGISEIVSMVGSLMVGTVLVSMTNKIEMLPGFLILFPGFLELRGNTGASLSSRLASGMFLHIVKPKMKKNKIVQGNIIAALILSIIIGTFIGFIAYFGAALFGYASIKIIYIAIIAAVISSVIEIPTTVAITMWLFRRGHDPNNIMGPYVTTTGDIISIIALTIAITVV